MGERFTFECWNCNRNYTLFREITEEQTLIVACPFCGKEGVVDLAPFRKKVKSVMREKENKQELGEEWVLPEVLTTKGPA